MAGTTTILLLTLLALSLTTLTLLTFRLHQILNPKRPKPRRYPSLPTHILIILGSGGHTAEMLSMLRKATVPTSPTSNSLNWTHFTHRTYLISSGDSLSASRAQGFEEELSTTSPPSLTHPNPNKSPPPYKILTVPRARKIHQPIYTAPYTSLLCLASCLYHLGSHPTANSYPDRDFPDMILCNGPATSVICVLASIILRFVNWNGCETRGKMRTVYVESWARVRRLSLSGRLLEGVVDRFLVQWEQLASEGGKGWRGGVGKGREFMGVLV